MLLATSATLLGAPATLVWREELYQGLFNRTQSVTAAVVALDAERGIVRPGLKLTPFEVRCTTYFNMTHGRWKGDSNADDAHSNEGNSNDSDEDGWATD